MKLLTIAVLRPPEPFGVGRYSLFGPVPGLLAGQTWETAPRAAGGPCCVRASRLEATPGRMVQ